ncbi:hypothetical protein ABPG75_002550 [Micractinium tetrahymenae]
MSIHFAMLRGNALAVASVPPPGWRAAAAVQKDCRLSSLLRIQLEANLSLHLHSSNLASSAGARESLTTPAALLALPAMASHQDWNPTTAVIVGGGVAGLLAAHVACKHFSSVTLIEGDRLERGAAVGGAEEALQGSKAHKGIPQYMQPHTLAMGGLHAMELLLPGLHDELVRRGGVPLDFAKDIRFFDFGAPNIRCASSLKCVGSSRHLIQSTLQDEVISRNAGRLTVRDGCRVAGLLWSPDKSAVEGLELSSGEQLTADVVIMAAGRFSRLPQWLAAAGHAVPSTQKVDAELTYVGRLGEVWRRLQRAAALGGGAPAGWLLVIGDAVQALNPVYAQGMSVASMSALALDAALSQALAGSSAVAAQRAAVRGMGPAFQKRLAGVIAPAWQMATSEDLRYPGTKAEGVTRPPWLISAYLDSLFRACHHDVKAMEIFFSIAHMTRPPHHLFHPRLVAAAAG